MTQSELGKVLGVDNGTISRWEQGLMLPEPRHVEAICSFFNKTYEFFTDERGPTIRLDQYPSLPAAALPEDFTDVLARLISDADVLKNGISHFMKASPAHHDLINFVLSSLDENEARTALEFLKSMRRGRDALVQGGELAGQGDKPKRRRS